MSHPLSSLDSLWQMRTRARPVAILGAVLLAAGIFWLVSNRPRKAPPLSRDHPTVGIEAPALIVLDRKDYTVAPTSEGTPVLVRIVSIEPSEGQFRYQVFYTGLEKGTFNLTHFMLAPDGERPREPVVSVTVDSLIPSDALYSHTDIEVLMPSMPKPYKISLLFGTLLWVGWGVALFRPLPKKLPPPPAPEPERLPETLAQVLRPLVEKAANKSISTEEKARLEQILTFYWGTHLELDHLDEEEQRRRIFEHPEAGQLLHTLEQWLYQPEALVTPSEINEAVRPYRDLPALDLPAVVSQQVASSEKLALQTASLE